MIDAGRLVLATIDDLMRENAAATQDLEIVLGLVNWAEKALYKHSKQDPRQMVWNCEGNRHKS